MEGPGFSQQEEKDVALNLPQRRKMEILFAVLLTLFLVRARPDDRRHGAAHDRQRPERHARALHVGRHDLPAHGDDHRRLLRQAVGPLRPPGDAADRRVDLPARIVPVGTVLEHGSADRLPRPAGRRRRRDLPRLAGGHRRPVHARGTRQVQGLFGAVFGVSSIIGPLLGGWLTEHLSAGTGSSSSTCRSARSRCTSSIATCRTFTASAARMRDLDYLGAVVFTVAVGFLLVGLTYKGVNNPQTGALYTGPIRSSVAASSSPRCGAIFLWIEVAREAAHRAARPVQEPGLQLDDHRDVPVGDRLLRGDRVPATVVPVRARASARPIGSPDPGAAGRSDPQLDRLGDHRQPDGSLQDPGRGLARGDGAGDVPDDRPDRRRRRCRCCGCGCSSRASVSARPSRSSRS